MKNFLEQGKQIKIAVKSMIIDYMNNNIHCAKNGYGVKQADIFHDLGLGVKTYPKATLSNQQYWMIALLYELQDEGKIEHICDKGPWRLK